VGTVLIERRLSCAWLTRIPQEQISRFVAHISSIQWTRAGLGIEYRKYEPAPPVFNDAFVEYGKYVPRNAKFAPRGGGAGIMGAIRMAGPCQINGHVAAGAHLSIGALVAFEGS